MGVGIILLRGNQVLLIRRGKPPRLGEWSLPGGGQELGEAVEATGRRELAEETGMTIAGNLILIDVVDLINRDDAGRVRFHYTLVDFAGRAGPGTARAGDDCAAVAWVDVQALAGLGLWDRTVEVIDLAVARLG